jgi:HD superfamily phosphohydrolase
MTKVQINIDIKLVEHLLSALIGCKFNYQRDYWFCPFCFSYENHLENCARKILIELLESAKEEKEATLEEIQESLNLLEYIPANENLKNLLESKHFETDDE